MITFPKLLHSTDPKSKENEETRDTWWFLLKDMEDESFLFGCAKVCREVAELYPNTNIVALIRNAAQGSKEDVRNRALVAWQEVVDAIGPVGSNQSVQFEDRVIHSCVKGLGGWIALATGEIDEQKWRRKEFLELYAAHAHRTNHPDKLIGRVEQHNRAAGFLGDIPDPVLIGMTIENPLLPEAKVAPMLGEGNGREAARS